MNIKQPYLRAHHAARCARRFSATRWPVNAALVATLRAQGFPTVGRNLAPLSYHATIIPFAACGVFLPRDLTRRNQP